MSTPAEHYRKAEKIVTEMLDGEMDFEADTINLALAQVHATLATVDKTTYLESTQARL